MTAKKSQLCVLFGAHVRRLRGLLGMTQAEVAKRAGIERTSITNIESGTQNVPLRTIESIAFAFRITPQQLLQGMWK